MSNWTRNPPAVNGRTINGLRTGRCAKDVAAQRAAAAALPKTKSELEMSHSRWNCGCEAVERSETLKHATGATAILSQCYLKGERCWCIARWCDVVIVVDFDGDTTADVGDHR
ncbi:hypothetical protein ZIOFF_014275 [Zingiber officinale]|uniref:Uncharacterized protein n=1 Tax=Zingiber officinale TaxID=94328 RepID=A0A8J5HH37_ZINOF|nr:hypothetical protein ZIOFF_014275 [Zingiber officinale]